eukprot:SAG31_NODE_40074_length_283_cov_1.103261_1_plen_72_part_10
MPIMDGGSGPRLPAVRCPMKLPVRQSAAPVDPPPGVVQVRSKGFSAACPWTCDASAACPGTNRGCCILITSA